MAYKYPYGNTEKMNLDWLLSQWVQLKDSFYNLIAPAWAYNVVYAQGSLVMNDSKLYRAIEEPTTGTFITEEWEEIRLSDILEGN